MAKSDEKGGNKNKYVVTPERIKELKAKRGTVHVISVKRGENDVVQCVLADPFEKDMNIVSAALAKKDVVQRNLFLLDNLWIEGDEAFKNDNKVRLTGSVEASGLVDVLEADTVKH